jgi:ABC-type nitrate/sulfonate/bicarbonate transport system substrate-binding protein
MRTTITLEQDVAEAAQAMARASGRRLGAVVSELVRRGLRAPAGPGPAVPATRRFATFAVTADTKPFSLKAARRAWEESA